MNRPRRSGRRSKMDNAHHDFLANIRAAGPGDPVPTSRVLADHLNDRIARIGDTALAEFAYLQKIAAETWGAEFTAHFARVLRNARVTPKMSRKSKWQQAMEAAMRLPEAWRPAMFCQIERSRAKRCGPGNVIWSADYCLAVTAALCRWDAYAADGHAPLIPGGAMLDRYGAWLIDTTSGTKPTSVRTASDYLSRIHAGLALVAPETVSHAREFVVRDWRERADRFGPTTKTGAQLVGASTLYALGFDLMLEGRSRPLRGLHAAKDFRNGILFAVAASLPERARALSALDFESTLRVPGGDAIHVRIPAEMLKMREDRKDEEPFDLIFHNSELAEALREYRHTYRPLFDDGSCLFPSIKATGHAISEQQIGRLAGDITLRVLGVRIPIHRLRDNVATEASENLDGGRVATKVLLRHADIATGSSYDHSDGMTATRDFGDLLERRRSAPIDLAL